MYLYFLGHHANGSVPGIWLCSSVCLSICLSVHLQGKISNSAHYFSMVFVMKLERQSKKVMESYFLKNVLMGQESTKTPQKHFFFFTKFKSIHMYSFLS